MILILLGALLRQMKGRLDESQYVWSLPPSLRIAFGISSSVWPGAVMTSCSGVMCRAMVRAMSSWACVGAMISTRSAPAMAAPASLVMSESGAKPSPNTPSYSIPPMADSGSVVRALRP